MRAEHTHGKMTASTRQKVVIVGAGPVGSLAALYAASRGDDVEVYELRAGRSSSNDQLLSIQKLI
jgi:kynurenine 3-monooxygenase